MPTQDIKSWNSDITVKSGGMLWNSAGSGRMRYNVANTGESDEKLWNVLECFGSGE